jgi:hypothetical protein
MSWVVSISIGHGSLAPLICLADTLQHDGKIEAAICESHWHFGCIVLKGRLCRQKQKQ